MNCACRGPTFSPSTSVGQLSVTPALDALTLLAGLCKDAHTHVHTFVHAHTCKHTHYKIRSKNSSKHKLSKSYEMRKSDLQIIGFKYPVLTETAKVMAYKETGKCSPFKGKIITIYTIHCNTVCYSSRKKSKCLSFSGQ